MTYLVNPAITFITPEAPTIDTSSAASRRRLLQYEIAKEQQRITHLQQEKAVLENKIASLETEINTLTLYERERATKELSRYKNELRSFPEIQDNTAKLRLQLQDIRNTPTAKQQPVAISGYISYLNTQLTL